MHKCNTFPRCVRARPRARARATLSFIATGGQIHKTARGKSGFILFSVNAARYTTVSTAARARARGGRGDTTRSGSNGRLHLRGARNVLRFKESVCPCHDPPGARRFLKVRLISQEGIPRVRARARANARWPRSKHRAAGAHKRAPRARR